MNPDTVRVVAVAEPREQALSKRVELTLRVEGTAVQRIEWPTDLLDELTARTWMAHPVGQSPPVPAEDKDGWNLRVALEPFVVGRDQLVRFQAIKVWIAGEAQPRKLEIEPISLSITSPLSADLKHILPATDYDDGMPLKQQANDYWPLGLGILLLILGGYFCWRLRQRLRHQTPIAPGLGIAQRISQLKPQEVPQELPRLLRKFIQDKDAIPAATLTRQELLAELQKVDGWQARLGELEALLERLETAHFSGIQLDESEARMAIEQAQELVTANRVSHS